MQEAITEVDAEALAQEIRQSQAVTVVDVREPWEHALGTLPGAQLLALSEMPECLARLQVDKHAPVVTFCHHGVRSLKAAACLMKAGFSNVRSLSGGIDAWAQRVDPTVGRY